MGTRIAAFGESDIMLIFKAVGIDVFPVTALPQDLHLLRKPFPDVYLKLVR
ncbi:unnamed protein product [marine sediment metagenome]|uniref:Uncharacterized protein n=1 Tax=marine sediment metagenome TaxID=412755 RepID=X1P2J5_9ZZZZ